MNAENKLGIKIKEIRKSMGYTQAKLAELANIDDKHLSKIENGIHLPTYKTLKKLSEILNFNFQDLNKESASINLNPIYLKAIKILNSARDNNELSNYYDALKLANKLMKK